MSGMFHNLGERGKSAMSSFRTSSRFSTTSDSSVSRCSPWLTSRSSHAFGPEALNP